MGTRTTRTNRTAPDSTWDSARQSAPISGPVVEAVRRVTVDLLSAHPGNVRTDLRLDDGFVASVRAEGVRVPLKIVPASDPHSGGTGGGFRVVDGHRRLAAALKAGRTEVPCELDARRADDEAGQFLDMVVTARYHAALSPLEEADALFSAHAAGATKTRLGKATGLKRDTVSAALTAARLGTETRQITGRATYAWTLEQLAALAEFEDDPADVQRLTAAAENSRFSYVLERLRAERADRAEHTRLRQEYEAAGYTITEDAPDSGVALHFLDHDGETLTEDGHAACDGRGVYFRAYEPTRFIHYCTDPDRYGHTDRRTVTVPRIDADGTDADGTDQNGNGAAGAPRNPDEPERRVVVEGNKAWKAAGAARREFLAALIARKTPPPQVTRFLAHALTSMPTPLGRWLPQAPTLPLFAELLGSTAGADGGVRKTTDKRLPLLMLASIATAYEHGMTVAGDSAYVWRTDRYSTCPCNDAGAWLRFLTELGHTLSPIEQAVADDTTYTGDTPPAEPTGEPLADAITDPTADPADHPNAADFAPGTDAANGTHRPDDAQSPDGAPDGVDAAAEPGSPDHPDTAQEPDPATGADDPGGPDGAGHPDGAALTAVTDASADATPTPATEGGGAAA